MTKDLDIVRAAIVDSGDARSREPARLALRALGDAGDRDAVAPLIKLLSRLVKKDDSLLIGHGTIALERIGDPSAAVPLQRMLPTASDAAVYWLTRAIRRLTGHSVPGPAQADWEADPKSAMAEWRDGWSQIDLAGQPMPSVTWEEVSSVRVEAVVNDGRDVFSLEPNDISGSSGRTWHRPGHH
ncbi:MAG: HEAT repeat domain-containing protein [Micrococcales bacterium]|nr:HEAT repeat domain-containing protein [Micrococcales bacterium]